MTRFDGFDLTCTKTRGLAPLMLVDRNAVQARTSIPGGAG
jgi:hypothetical protein